MVVGVTGLGMVVGVIAEWEGGGCDWEDRNVVMGMGNGEMELWGMGECVCVCVCVCMVVVVQHVAWWWQQWWWGC